MYMRHAPARRLLGHVVPQCQTGPEVIKLFFMLNSAENELVLLINVKMPTIVGILTMIDRKNFMQS